MHRNRRSALSIICEHRNERARITAGCASTRGFLESSVGAESSTGASKYSQKRVIMISTKTCLHHHQPPRLSTKLSTSATFNSEAGNQPSVNSALRPHQAEILVYRALLRPSLQDSHDLRSDDIHVFFLVAWGHGHIGAVVGPDRILHYGEASDCLITMKQSIITEQLLVFWMLIQRWRVEVGGVGGKLQRMRSHRGTAVIILVDIPDTRHIVRTPVES